MNIEAGISALILVFVLVGAVYDVELSPEGRALHSRKYRCVRTCCRCLSVDAKLTDWLCKWMLGGRATLTDYCVSLLSIDCSWRRLQNWFPMGVAYAAFYMARYNVAAGNVSSIRDQLQFSSTFMGW